jgi:hypothetical protein
LIGVELSKQEAQVIDHALLLFASVLSSAFRQLQLMSDNFLKELRKFDVERVLPAWDALVRGQQARFEALKIPTMFVTSETGDVEVCIQFPPNGHGIPLSVLARGLCMSHAHAKYPLLLEATQGCECLGRYLGPRAIQLI